MFERDETHSQDVVCKAAPTDPGDVAFVRLVRDLAGREQCCAGGTVEQVALAFLEGVTGLVARGRVPGAGMPPPPMPSDGWEMPTCTSRRVGARQKCSISNKARV